MRPILLALIFISINCFPQLPRLSKYEKRWALLHPFAAFKIKKIHKKATVIYIRKETSQALDNFSNGGKLDAFRHSFYMAAFAQKIKIKKLRTLGLAHEKYNYKQFLKSQYEEGEVPDSLSSVMDLQNNELGLRTGSENKKADLEALKKNVIEKINNGEAVVMNRLKNGTYLDCDNRPVVITATEKKWNLPKCLVKSNIHYID